MARERSPFARHIKRMREVRRLTQEQVAERAGLAADTIRRLEQGSFSPSLRTLRKVAAALEISLSTLFAGFELPVADPEIRELVDLLEGRSRQTVKLVTRVVIELLAVLEDQS